MTSGFVGTAVVIVGAASRTGFVTAAAFAVEEANLGLIDRDPSALAEAAGCLGLYGGKVETVTADPADPEARRAAIGVLLDIFDRVDVLIATAEGPAPRSCGKQPDDVHAHAAAPGGLAAGRLTPGAERAKT